MACASGSGRTSDAGPPASSSRQASTLAAQALPALSKIDSRQAADKTSEATKRIHTDADVQIWIASKAHDDLVLFVGRLCEAAVGKPTRRWEKSAARADDAIDRTAQLLETLQTWVQEIEPLKTPQRFGNLAFREWGRKLEESVRQLHLELLPDHLKVFAKELEAYLLGSFGSWTRLDYGSGHELSFAAWLCFLARLCFFDASASKSTLDAMTQAPLPYEERLALEIFPKYLELAWSLQDRYGLEPAGSHGVWGLDDYQFIPYAIGAAQLRTQTEYRPLDYSTKAHKPDPSPMPPKDLLAFIPPSSSSLSGVGGFNAMRGLSASSTPATASSAPPFANLFTSSIARIHSLKRGPFSEHSPILFDVATTVPHWVKVHAGMMKMWTAECLHKRPVVQHFPFGGVGFIWHDSKDGGRLASEDSAAVPRPEMDPSSRPATTARAREIRSSAPAFPAAQPTLAMAPTTAPWAKPGQASRQATPMPPTAAPWARTTSSGSSSSSSTMAISPDIRTDTTLLSQSARSKPPGG